MRSQQQIPVLVIEDEEAIRRGLCDVLAFHGYAPEGAERGDEGLELGLAGEHELVILDVMLPGMNGFDVCEKLRAARPTLPILMLTARGSEEDILRGFRCGSDDYVTKPFSIAELMARAESLLRRGGAFDRPGAESEAFEFGSWKVDPANLEARDGASQVDLTRRELEILAFLFRERGRIVSRRILLREIWNYPDPDKVETRTIDMHIAKLRKKLAPGTGGAVQPASLIETIRGEGYRYSG